MAVRSFNFFLLIYLTIKIADFSARAGINFGVIMSIISLSIIFQAILYWLFFGERLNKKMVGGIFIVILGVTLISISKSSEVLSDSNHYSDEEKSYYKYLAIALSVLNAAVSSFRAV